MPNQLKGWFSLQRKEGVVASKVEQCFMMTYENNSQSKNNLLLLSTKLLEKQRLMEECLAVNDRVVHQLLSTSQRHNELLGYPLKTVTSSSSDQKEESSNSNNNNNKRGGGRLFHEIKFVPSATSESSSSTVSEYDDLGQLMGNGGLMHDDDTNKENEGYDTALQVIHHTARDWTYGAMTCRDETIGWIVRAIIEYSSGGVHNLNNGGNDLLRVLVPGAGLGRLAYDISTCRDLIEKNGVIPIVEANDSSVTMIFAAQNVLKMLQRNQRQQQ